MKKANTFIASTTFLLSILGLFVFVAPQASAATFTVDSTADDGDSDTGDGLCDEGSGDCTLRAALEQANELAGADTIEFNIAGGGVHTFTPTTQLEVSDEVTIDGETQTGAACGTLVPDELPAESNTPHTLLIEINPAGADQGIYVSGADTAGSVIRGLVINSAVAGIEVDTTDSVTIECNYLGTNAAGTSVIANGAYGIAAQAPNMLVQNNLVAGSASEAISVTEQGTVVTNNLIGSDANGTAALGDIEIGIMLFEDEAQVLNNVIVGSEGDGIVGGGTDNTSITGNYIGVGIDGTALGNGGTGIHLYGGSELVVGDAGVEERNIIAASGADGFHLENSCETADNSTAVEIMNNYIGTNVEGEVEDGYGNGGSGIVINEFDGECASVTDFMIGNPASDNGKNIIAGNDEHGVLLYQTDTTDVRDISIIANSIFGNGGLGINLAHDSDDDGDADEDTGVNPLNLLELTNPAPKANNYVNYPVINDIELGNGEVTIDYDLDANEEGAGMNEIIGYRLDFYVSNAKDGSNHGEGQTHLGSFMVDGSEDDATHTFDTELDLTDDMYLSATTTILESIPPPP